MKPGNRRIPLWNEHGAKSCGGFFKLLRDERGLRRLSSDEPFSMWKVFLLYANPMQKEEGVVRICRLKFRITYLPKRY
jgi:hypothetical protein